MIRKALAASTGLLMALAPVSAAAQGGAMWVDRQGRMMSLQFSGGNGAPPAPADRTAAQIAALFQSLCVATEGDPARIAAAAAAAGAGLTAQPETVPGARNAPPLVLDIWRGEGLVVTRTAGFFAAPNAQCNAIFYVPSLPDKAAVVAALTAALGAPPANADQAVRRNGRPNPHYAPEWSVAGGRMVVAHVVAGSQYMPGNRVHIGIRVR